MTRVQPAQAADERTSLDQFLDYHRETLLDRTDGLDAAAMRQRLPTSELSLGGLLKHSALVEDDWIQVDFLGRPSVEPWASAPWDEDRDWEFHSADADDPEALRDLYRAACERSRQALVGRGLDDLSAGRHRSTGEPWTLRWILLHLIEETARHNGHADLLREAIDGRTGT